MLESIELFINRKVNIWSRCNYEPFEDMEKEYNLEKAWRKLKLFFVEDNLEFPKLCNKMIIRDIYWTGLYNKEISVDADESEIEIWFDKKLEEEARKFDEID